MKHVMHCNYYFILIVVIIKHCFFISFLSYLIRVFYNYFVIFEDLFVDWLHLSCMYQAALTKLTKPYQYVELLEIQSWNLCIIRNKVTGVPCPFGVTFGCLLIFSLSVCNIDCYWRLINIKSYQNGQLWDVNRCVLTLEEHIAWAELEGIYSTGTYFHRKTVPKGLAREVWSYHVDVHH